MPQTLTIKRYVKRYRQRGAKGFFMSPKRREGRQLTTEMLSKARSLLEEGQSAPEVSRITGVLANTIHKAIRTGRLPPPAKKVSGASSEELAYTLSERNAHR